MIPCGRSGRWNVLPELKLCGKYCCLLFLLLASAYIFLVYVGMLVLKLFLIHSSHVSSYGTSLTAGHVAAVNGPEFVVSYALFPYK